MGKSQQKIHKVMSEWKHGGLHSGSKTGPIVTSRHQAIAIALSEARRSYHSGGAAGVRKNRSRYGKR